MAFNDLDSQNLTIPRGKALFHPFLTGTKTLDPKGSFDIGNVPGLTLSVDVQRKDHYRSSNGMMTLDNTFITKKEYSGALVTDDMGETNKALWALGQVSTVTATSLTAQTQNITGVKGRTYQVGVSPANPTGHKKITVTAIASYVAGTDYIVDSIQGLVTIPTTSTIPDNTALTINYSVAVSTRTRISAPDSTGIEGRLIVIQDNPVGANKDFIVPYIQINPSGDLSLIADPESDAFSQISLQCKVLKLGSYDYYYEESRAV
jgi:hypothetical protein